MRRFQSAALAAVAVVGFASVASAADMPVKAPTAAPALAAPWSWSGIYVGAHAGGAWATIDWLTNSRVECANFTTQCDPANTRSSRFIGGGQLGVRWQTGAWVYGVEGSLAGTSLDGHGCSGIAGCVSAGGGPDYEAHLKTLATATVQFGHAWDRSLWYVKGGYAGAQITLDRIVVSPIGGGSEWANGWTVGTGYEYLLTQNFSLGVEYSYIGLIGRDILSCPAGTAFSACAPPLDFSNIKIGVQQVVARLNYKFDWPGLH